MAVSSCLEYLKDSGSIGFFFKSLKKRGLSPLNAKLTKVSSLEKEEAIKRVSKSRSTPKEIVSLELDALPAFM